MIQSRWTTPRPVWNPDEKQSMDFYSYWQRVPDNQVYVPYPVPGAGITSMALSVEGSVPGLDEEGFRAAAEQAKENCPVSGALKGNVEITLDASLG